MRTCKNISNQFKSDLVKFNENFEVAAVLALASSLISLSMLLAMCMRLDTCVISFDSFGLSPGDASELVDEEDGEELLDKDEDVESRCSVFCFLRFKSTQFSWSSSSKLSRPVRFILVDENNMLSML